MSCPRSMTQAQKPGQREQPTWGGRGEPGARRRRELTENGRLRTIDFVFDAGNIFANFANGGMYFLDEVAFFAGEKFDTLCLFAQAS
jgi:hypothetical protein